MRGLAVALALLLLPLAQPGAAQGEEPAFSDPAGDVTLALAAAGQPLPAAPAPDAENARTADLVSLHARETDDALQFSVALASLQGSAVATSVEVDFEWTGGAHRLAMTYLRSDAFGGSERRWATLFRDDGEAWQWVARLPPVFDPEAGTLAAEVPKVYLVTPDDRMPSRGDLITITGVSARGGAIDFPFADAETRDRMPDDEATTATLTLERGDFTQGNLLLSSPDRVRVSNGGATTFVFQVAVGNTGEVEEEYALAIADAPDGWDAKVQSPLKVPPRSERTIGVLVSVPFEHEHGGYSSFNLTVEGTRDATSRARMRMGVLHTPIPQPAGHHQELYLHARARDLGPYSESVNTAFPMSWGWMNTDAEHADDAAYYTPASEGGRSVWTIPLNPALEMGLDFDITTLGKLEGSILGKREAEVELRASLHYHHGERGEAHNVKLADAPTTTIALRQQDATPFSLDLTPTEESDYIPYRPDAQMVLTISIDAPPTDNARYASYLDPQLLVEPFRMQLPLNEYHDRLTGAAEAAEVLEIVAEGPVEKAGLPGSIMTYAFTLRNGGPPDVFVIELAGNDAHEGIVVPRGQIPLGTGETRNVTLAVEIPVNANPDQEFEVLLFVHALDDPSKMVVARTKTRATHTAGEATPDETARLLDAQARETQIPAPGLAAFALALAVALALRRR